VAEETTQGGKTRKNQDFLQQNMDFSIFGGMLNPI
jgi:hypothetical protein